MGKKVILMSFSYHKANDIISILPSKSFPHNKKALNKTIEGYHFKTIKFPIKTTATETEGM